MLGRVHGADHLLDLVGQVYAASDNLEKLCWLLPFNEQAFVDQLLVELLDLVLVKPLLLCPVLDLLQCEQATVLLAHDVELHQTQLDGRVANRGVLAATQLAALGQRSTELVRQHAATHFLSVSQCLLLCFFFLCFSPVSINHNSIL